MTEFVTVEQLVNELELEVFSGNDYLDRKIYTADISRPGLELTGYFNYYPADRIQLFGKKETTFLERMSSDEKRIVMKKLCNDDTPVFVFSRGLTPTPELVEAAKEKGVTILTTKRSTSRISGLMSNFIDSKLAPRTSIHGVLVEIYGLGVLIQGDSGIGKSETGLELIKKGHRLVADDRVDVYQQDERTVIGEPAPILEHLMEIRGIGIIDVMNLFGASSVRKSVPVQLVVKLEHWTPDKQFDRLGGAEQTFRIADVDVPMISIPVKTGRNVAIIIEVAAMNFRAKSMGYNATEKFEDNLSKLIETNSEQ
ncbi:HPr(Ser) kinase/phosphatase [Vagococcus xieshaowenii]|uniref:HPr kinase/phosphorylase n=1 Tax=Vagococcus xieshaowenii TaxID=2562451 RepID=A0AAJ5EGB4_9ENTE|nr:HPr(Ser) kinase/phosphatase [Vagococcus xieshaowenii]QCA28520.1 HPr kinase/phosphorylase [Vagococcus xieshaowenii]TFZ42727.1 HPr kinase/phosphorylase [Vagococcus xieshaowenii]